MVKEGLSIELTAKITDLGQEEMEELRKSF
jgi:hypothetical protein